MSSDDKKNSSSSTIKSLSTLITSIVALIAALGSLVKPQDMEPLQKSYEILSTHLQKINNENIKQQESIVALKASIDILIRTLPLNEVHYDHRKRITSSDHERSFYMYDTDDIEGQLFIAEVTERMKPIEQRTFEEIID